MVIVALLHVRTYGMIDLQCESLRSSHMAARERVLQSDDDGFIGLRLFLVLKCLSRRISSSLLR